MGLFLKVMSLFLKVHGLFLKVQGFSESIIPKDFFCDSLNILLKTLSVFEKLKFYVLYNTWFVLFRILQYVIL